MFIELAEYLMCPVPHAEPSHCIVVPDTMERRMVLAGVVGCPVCRAQYPISDGTVWFGDPPRVAAAAAPLPEATVVQALLNLSGPGGYVVLLGTAAGLADELGSLVEGVGMIVVNPVEGAVTGAGVSRIATADRIPLTPRMARAVVAGEEFVTAAWLSECVRVLLPGLRLVAFGAVSGPPGVEELAVGDGLWVGVKR